MKSHINILQYQFPITFPFHEGYPLTLHLSNVFNHHRADNIRKIARRWVIEAVNSSPNQLLSVEELAKLSSRIAALDRGYEFTARDEPPPSILEQHITIVATQVMKEMGLSSPYELERIKLRLDVQHRAREILLAGQMFFEDLLS